MAVEGWVKGFDCVEGLQRQGLQCQEMSLATQQMQYGSDVQMGMLEETQIFI